MVPTNPITSPPTVPATSPPTALPTMPVSYGVVYHPLVLFSNLYFKLVITSASFLLQTKANPIANPLAKTIPDPSEFY
jgi:hypothetical protein